MDCYRTVPLRIYVRTLGLQDTEDLVTGDEAHLRDTVRVTEGDTNLRRRQTLAGQLADVVDDILRGGLEPRRRSAAVGEGRGRYPTNNLRIGASMQPKDGNIQMPFPGACMRPMLALHVISART